MGKSNRIRSEKSQSTINAALKNKKKGTPSWVYSLLVAIVAVFVVASLVVGVLSSSGFMMRNTKAIYSDNYTINGNMLTYMFMSEYQQFQSDYSSYMSYFSLDTSKSLKDQTYGDTEAGGYEKSFLGEFEGTWYDFFMNSVKTQAEQLLVYCEEADARGITLDDADKANIEAAITELELMAAMYGYSTDAYVALSYGQGVKVKDIRKFTEITTLAAKCASVVDEEIIDNITDDEIAAKYDANKKEYNVVDYVYYGVYVDYDDVIYDVIADYDGKTELTDEQEAKVLEEYKKQIADAKAKSDTFKAYTTIDEFIDAMLNDIANTEFDDLYTTEALADADKLSDEALATVKEAMIAKVIEEVKAGAKETADETGELEGEFLAYGLSITENAAKALDSIKEDLFKTVNNSNTTYNVDRVGYDENNEVAKWAFDNAKEIGATHRTSAGDGADDAKEITSENGYFDTSVYMLKTPEYCDKTLSKDVAYMTFSTEDAAKKAIESFKNSANKGKEDFEAVAKANAAVTNGVFENYLEGQLTYNGFEEWLYDDATVIGSYTETPVANAEKDATEYAVFLYVEDGDEAWFIDVQSAIYAEDYEALYDSMSEKYPVTVKEKVLGKVNA